MENKENIQETANAETKEVNKKQETFNGLIVGLLIKVAKIQQLLSNLLDSNNYGDTYMFEDFKIIDENSFKNIQDSLIIAINLLSKCNVNAFEYVNRKDKNE